MAIIIGKDKNDNKETKNFRKVKLSHLLMGRFKFKLFKLFVKFIQQK